MRMTHVALLEGVIRSELNGLLFVLADTTVRRPPNITAVLQLNRLMLKRVSVLQWKVYASRYRTTVFRVIVTSAYSRICSRDPS